MLADRTPTEFGLFIMRAMAAHDPPLNQGELAKRADVSQSTISRWIYSPGKPDTRRLDRLATALDVDYGELLSIAGHGRPAERVPDPGWPTDRLAQEIDAMLGGTSPLTEADRQYIRSMVDRVIDPYRRQMKRRRSA